MRILNFGSLNIDYVYRVAHIVQPGETLASTSFATFAGGKGANQSVALARAGAPVWHAGQVGREGAWLLDKLRGAGVQTEFTLVSAAPTGHAIIQVDDRGQNAIVLFAGANKTIGHAQIERVLGEFGKGDVLLAQNEINDLPLIMRTARRRGMSICFNPAPMGPEVAQYPLDLVDMLVVNETEGAALIGRHTTPEAGPLMKGLAKVLPRCQIVLTRGAAGVIYRAPGDQFEVPARKAEAVDTTAAGDTFIGYYLAARAEGRSARACVERACAAAAICVSRPGAMDSIPTKDEVRE